MAAAAILLLVFAAIPLVAPHQGEANRQGAYGGGSYNPPPATSVNYALITENACERPQSREDAALCYEARSALAAERQARWTEIQGLIAIAGLAALIATLIYTRNGVDIARRALITAERAYVYAPSLSLHNKTQPRRWWVRAHVTNFGSTPAKNVRVRHIAFIREYPPRQPLTLPASAFGRDTFDIYAPNTVGAHPWCSVRVRSAQDVWDIRAGRKAIYYVLDIQYDDAFGKRHRTFHCFACADRHQLRSGLFKSVEGTEAT